MKTSFIKDATSTKKKYELVKFAENQCIPVPTYDSLSNYIQCQVLVKKNVFSFNNLYSRRM